MRVRVAILLTVLTASTVLGILELASGCIHHSIQRTLHGDKERWQLIHKLEAEGRYQEAQEILDEIK